MRGIFFSLVAMLALALAGVGGLAHAQPADPAAATGPVDRSQNVEVALLSQRAASAPGDVFHVAIRQRIAKDWHTYWRNSGDSGEPTRIAWTLPEGVKAGAIQWPAPEALPFGPLVNYGFSEEVVLPVRVEVPAGAVPGTNLRLVARVEWLECSDVCIPGDADVAIDIPVAAAATDGPDAGVIARTLAGLPKPLEGSARLTPDGPDGWRLSIVGAALSGASKAYFFPYELSGGALIDFAKPQTLSRGPDGISLALQRSPSAPESLDGPAGGVLVLGEGARRQAFEISADPGPPLGGTGGGRPSGATDGLGFWAALGFAFLGGLILNLMPCVLPILSMKALGLAKAAHEGRTRARLHGLMYGAGVVVSFLALAGALIGLQAAGAAVGWGFQLQSPVALVALATLMTLIGLNLLGVFEVGSSLQSLAGSGSGAPSDREAGPGGSFFTGVLAVVVAAPCTAPFMGAALGFAATQPPLVSLTVFAALGLGFAGPFVALTFAPGLLRAMPKPGAWMARFKEFLAFPMFATAVWLVWVLAAQAGQPGVLAALSAMLAAGFGAWALAGLGGAGRALALASVLAVWAWSGWHAASAPPPSGSVQRGDGPSENGALASEPWSDDRVQALLAEGRPVLVNFTADWCVTCKVNEQVALTRPEVADALRETGAAYLVGDWTRRDPAIAAALARHGRIGVPLYLLYVPGQAEPKVLPQILTAGGVAAALRDGKRAP